MLAVVHVADAFVDAALSGKRLSLLDGRIDHEFLRRGGYARQFTAWCTAADDELMLPVNATALADTG